jgi:hypothetical protein
MLVDDDLMHVGIRRRSHTWAIAPATVSGLRVRGCPHLAATARLVRRVALCNSSMSVITQMLQRVITMAQTAMAVVDNHRGAAGTRFFTAPDRGGCSVFNPQSRPVRC